MEKGNQKNQKIIVIGDTHCNFQIIDEIIAKEEETGEILCILHVGDIGIYDIELLHRLTERERYLIQKHKNPVERFKLYLEGKKSFPYPVFAIAGNHEDFDLINELEKGEKKVHNLHLLKAGEQVKIPGTDLTLMGLGKILPAVVGEKNRKRKKYISPEELEATIQAGAKSPPDILLIHEAAFFKAEPEKGARGFGSPHLTKVVMETKPRLAISGHMHYRFESRLNDTRIIGLGYGATGDYGILDHDLNFHFGLEVDFEYPILNSPIYFEGAPPKQEKKPKKKKMTSLSLNDILKHYNLKMDKKKAKEHFGQFLKDFHIKWQNKEAFTIEDAYVILDDFVKKNWPG